MRFIKYHHMVFWWLLISQVDIAKMMNVLYESIHRFASLSLAKFVSYNFFYGLPHRGLKPRAGLKQAVHFLTNKHYVNHF